MKGNSRSLGRFQISVLDEGRHLLRRIDRAGHQPLESADDLRALRFPHLETELDQDERMNRDAVALEKAA